MNSKANAITVTVAMSVKPDQVETLQGKIPGMLEEALARPGVRASRALYNPAEPTKLLFIDEFDSVEASDAYFKWRAERGDLDQLGTLLTAPPLVEVWPLHISVG